MVRPATKAGVVYMTNSENGLSIGRQILAATLGGQQPPFDWLKYDNYDSAGLSFSRIAGQKGAGAALEQFSGELANGAIPEATVNQAGYMLMGRKKMEDAILLFRKTSSFTPTLGMPMTA